MNTHTSLKPIGLVLKEAWVLYRKHMNALALVSIVPFIFAGVGLTLRPELAVNRGAFLGTLAIVAVFSIVNLVFAILMPIAVISTIDEATQGRTLSANAAYEKAFSIGFPYLFVLLLTLIVVLGGGILFIIPGIIVNIYLAFVVFTFLLEGKRGIDALIQSAWYVKGLWFDILARNLIVAIVVILAMMVFGIIIGGIAFALGFAGPVLAFLFGLFEYMLIIPFAFCFAYVVYKDVKAAKVHSHPDAAFTAKTEKIFIILLLIAALVALIAFAVLSFGPHQWLASGVWQMGNGNAHFGGARMMTGHYYTPHGFMGY